LAAPAHLAPTHLSRDELITASLPWVDLTIRRICRGEFVHVAEEDVRQEARIGLIRAVDEFDPTRGRSFSSYVIERIRRAIQDCLRHHDPLPRRIQDGLRNAAKEHGEDSPEYEYWAGKAERYRPVPIVEAAPGQPDEPGVLVALDVTVDLRQGSAGVSQKEPPVEAVLAAERADRLLRAVQELCDPERAVLCLYYYDGLGLREIGERFGHSERWACTYRQRGIALLREQLQGAAELLVGAG
jgi:RNA polymerase sigma factor FliA